MPLYNTLESADELFRAADESFAALKRDITSAEWARIGHGEAERRVGSSGRNVLLCLYQCFLTLRALAEPIERGWIGRHHSHAYPERQGAKA